MFSKGDLVVYNGHIGEDNETIVGKIVEVPPIDFIKIFDDDFTDKYKIKTEPNANTYNLIDENDIIGLYENYNPDIKRHDWSSD